MRRFTDFFTGTLAGMLIGVAMCAAIAPEAWSVAPTPRPPQHADPGPGTPGRTMDGVSPVPSPSVAAGTGLPDRGTRPPTASPVATPSPSAIGTRPAPTVKQPVPQVPPATTRSVRGTATWFRSPQNVSAAGPRLRAAIGPSWRGTRVMVCGKASCTRTVLGDWMRADKLIDLHAPLFAAVCGPLSKGVCRVSVRW